MLVIEAIRRLLAEVRRMPRLVHVGLVIGVAAFALDVVIHLSPAHHHHPGFRPEEHIAHIAGLVAMVVILAGVVSDGLARQRARRRQRLGGPRHAHR